MSWIRIDFNPLSPCGERRAAAQPWPHYPPISTHSLRVERDHGAEGDRLGGAVISTHSLRVERDFRARRAHSPACYFNPLSPCGERRYGVCIQIVCHHFNPLSPCGERHPRCKRPALGLPISTHSLRVERDNKGYGEAGASWNFNPLSPCGERPVAAAHATFFC